MNKGNVLVVAQMVVSIATAVYNGVSQMNQSSSSQSRGLSNRSESEYFRRSSRR